MVFPSTNGISDILGALSALQEHDSIVAAAAGLIARQCPLSPPRVVHVHAVGPARFAARLTRLDGAQLADVIRKPLPWALNRPTALPPDSWPLHNAESTYVQHAVKGAGYRLGVHLGLYVGWVTWFTNRPDALDNAAALASVDSLHAALAAAHTLCPVPSPATFTISGRRPTPITETGRAWLAVPGASRTLMRAARSAPRPAWFHGARLTFEGHKPSLTATLTPFRRADVLAVAQLTHQERQVLEAHVNGDNDADIARARNLSIDAVRRMLRTSTAHHHALGTMVRAAWGIG